MNRELLTSRNLTPKQAVQVQKDLAGRVETIPLPSPREGLLIAGADCSYGKRAETGYAALVVCRWPSLEVVEVAGAASSVAFPYVPGLLSFRELPLLDRAWRNLRRTPDIVVVDGQGIAHPRRLGLAAHAGLVWGVPSIGCAKSRLIGEHRTPASKRGSCTGLFHEGERIGSVLRTRDGVKPLYVSPGHLSDIESCNRWILRLANKFRLPEVIRRAHSEVNRMRKKAAPDPEPQ